jgi:hypothetical protein
MQNKYRKKEKEEKFNIQKKSMIALISVPEEVDHYKKVYDLYCKFLKTSQGAK